MPRWKVSFSRKAYKIFKKLDQTIQKKISVFLQKKLHSVAHPRVLGKPLKGNLGDFWRYRIGDYRLICEIYDDELIILVIDLGHRSEIYTNH